MPTSASGVAELPGGNFMVTLGFWDEFVGRPFVRASTTFHELGHTLGLFHGGPETELTPNARWQPGAATLGHTGAPHPDRSELQGQLPELDELPVPGARPVRRHRSNPPGLLVDQTEPVERARPLRQCLAAGAAGSVPELSDRLVRAGPSPLAVDLGVTAAKRYCSGERFAVGVDPQMARVFVDFSADTIDWLGDGAPTGAAGHDGNFDNAIGTLGGFSDWDNIRLNQTGAVVTGVSSGSAEGVFFDNSGTANGVFFDNSGVFFDQSGVWFDNSGVWFDNAGGVFFDNSGVFFDNSGVFFDNSGVWFDNAGGVWFDNAGGVFFDNAGGVFFDNSGVFFDNAGGVFFDNSGQEISYDDARSFGRGRPHRIATCVIDETTGTLVSPQPLPPALPDLRICSTALPNTAAYHRNEVHFEQLQVGGISDYEIQRRSLAALNPTAYVTAGTVAAHLFSFTDLAEPADGIDYIYRVRGRSNDEFGNGGWSRLATETAVNIAPVAVNDGYSVAANTVLTVPAAHRCAGERHAGR